MNNIFRITIPQKQLREAIEAASKPVVNKSSLTIIQCLQLKATDNRLAVTGTDTIVWIKHETECVVTVDGQICIPADKLKSIVSAQPERDLVLFVDEDKPTTLVVKGAGTHSITGIDDPFPELLSVHGDHYFTISALNFGESLKKIEYALGGDTPVKQTANLVVLDSCYITANNGYIMSKSMFYPTEAEGKGSIPVPEAAARYLINLCTKPSELTVNYDEHKADFKFVQPSSTINVVTRFTDVKYPEYTRYVPNKFEKEIFVDRRALYDAVHRAAIAAISVGNKIILTVNSGGDALAVNGIDASVETEEVIDVESDLGSAPYVFAMNCKYLMATLSAIQSPTVKIQCGANLRPVVFTSDEEPNDVAIVVPMQVEGIVV